MNGARPGGGPMAMARRNERLLKCAVIALALSTIMTGFIPVANAAGWYRSVVLDSGLLFNQIGAGDADRDGHNELYVATQKGRLFKVYHSGTTWLTDELPSVPDSVQAMVLDDLNGDGFPEIYVAAQNAADNGRIYKVSYSGANWVTETIYKNFGSLDYPMDLATGDVDRDGIRDLYWIQAGGALRYAHLTSGWVTSTIAVTPAGHLRCMVTGDAMNAGYSQLYVGTDDDRVLGYGYNLGSWQSSEIGYAGFDSYWDYIRDIVIGDPDHSGGKEIYFAAGDREIMSLSYKSFTGDWDLQTVKATSEIDAINMLAIGDADGDGMDELFGAAGNNTIYYYPWYSDQSKWGRSDVSPGPLPDEAKSLIITEADDETTYKEIYATCEDGRVYRFSRDVDPPPPPIVWSPTHPVQVWKNVTVVKVEWKMGDDQSGIYGFSISWSTNGILSPDDNLDLAGSESKTESGAMPDTNSTYFGIKAMDGAGNWGRPVFYGPIYIDSTKPDFAALTINDGAKFSKSALVKLGVSAHDALSGIANMSFSNDLTHWSDWVPFQETYSAWDINQNSPGGITDGPRTVYLKVSDKAGNAAAVVQASITLDQTPPRGLGITINDGQRYTRLTDVDLKLTWDVDPEGAKVTGISFSNDENSWSPWENPAAFKAHWSLTNDPGGWSDDGEHKVYFRIKDEAGNIGGPTFAPVVLDRTPPNNLAIVVNNGQLVTKDTTVQLTLKADDTPEHSGLGYMAFMEEGGKWTDWMPWSTKATFVITSPEGTKIIDFKAKDKAGNEAEPVKGYVVHDTAAPRISHVRVLGISDKGAVVTWITDIPANSVVKYGLTANYNNAPFNSEMVTSHSITLSGLRPNTDYHFQVNSTNVPGSYAVSRDYTFTTTDLPDNIPPTITDLRVDGVTATTAVISWNTDEPSDTRLRYGTTTDYMFVEGDSKDMLEHRIVLRGLTPATKYFFMAQSSDSHGNGPTEDTGDLLTSATPDTTAPTISNLKVVGVTDTLAIITWNTNEPALGIIEYGTSQAYGQIAVTERYEMVHRVIITGLKPDTMYYLIVRAIDVVGNGPTTSDDLGFFTLKVPDRTAPVITNVKVEVVDATRAIVSWATDEPSDSGVNYHTGTGIGQTIYDMDLVETHSMALGGLTPNTNYTFSVESMDATGNGPSKSAEYTFRTGTTADNDAPGIFNITVKGISNNLAVVLWETDKAAKCFAEYGKATRDYTFQVQEEGYYGEHNLVLWNLAPQTTYYLRLQCKDAGGHGPTIGNEVNFATTGTPDKTPPKISDLRIWNISTDSATIEWKTDEPADTEVHYGKGGQMDLLAREKKYAFTHLLVLTNLQSNTSYKFTVLSTDPSGNQATGQELTFLTKAVYVPPIKPPVKPPVHPGGSSVQAAMPWIALAIVLMVVIGLTGFMYRQGLLKMGGDTSAVSSTTPTSMGGASASSEAIEVTPLVGGDEGLCPHCKGHISLSAAAGELSKERTREEERKRQEDAETSRREDADAQRKRQEAYARRATMAAAPRRAVPAVHGESEFVEIPAEGTGGGGEAADAQLAELYDEVEREKAPRAQERPAHHAALAHHAGHAKASGAVRDQVPKETPLKTVKCGHCGGRVPVYTHKRPVRITCPTCNKSGTLRG